MLAAAQWCPVVESYVSTFFMYICSCGSVVEHCFSSAKGCGFNSQGTHILTINVKKPDSTLKWLWIKASVKCINVHVIMGFVHLHLLI